MSVNRCQRALPLPDLAAVLSAAERFLFLTVQKRQKKDRELPGLCTYFHAQWNIYETIIGVLMPSSERSTGNALML